MSDSGDLPKRICAKPWMHLMLDHNGEVTVCCETSTYDPDEATLVNIRESDFLDAWNSEKLKKMRRDFLNGKMPDICENCRSNESNGMISDRILYTNRFRKELQERVQKTESDGSLSSDEIFTLDLRLSNVCNYSCRTCGIQDSSSWATDFAFLSRKKLDKVIIRPFDNIDETISKLKPTIEKGSVKHFFFLGGEPLIQAEHYKIVDFLIQDERFDSKLSYVSNMSTLRFGERNIIDIWNLFSEVDLTISLDALGEHGEYVRNGKKWDIFTENVRRVRQECPHVKLCVNLTVSTLNICDLLEVKDYCIEKLGILEERFYLSPVRMPRHYSVTCLPLEAKRAVKDFYMKKYGEGRYGEIRSLLNYMDSVDDSSFYSVFIKFNKQLDVLRSQSFSKTSFSQQVLSNF